MPRRHGLGPESMAPARRAGVALLTIVGVTVLVLSGLPATALAHMALASADPAPGARVGRPPTQVQLRFGKPTIPDRRNEVRVVGPSGKNIAHGPPSVSGLGISQPVTPAHEAGVYVVSYRVVAVDKHVTQGGYDFLLTTAAPRTSTRSSRAGPWVLGACGFLTVIVVGAMLLRSRRQAHRAT